MTDDASRISLVGFAVALVTVGVGTAVGLAFVPVVGTYVGMLAGGFVAGLVTSDRPTVEAGVAAVLANIGILLAGTLPGNGILEAVLALGSVSPVTLLISAAISFAVGAFGAHFGEDLRSGLTEPVEERSGRPITDVTGGGRTTGAESTDAESTDADQVDEADGDRASVDATDEGPTDAADPNTSDATDLKSADTTERRSDDAEFELEESE